MKLRKCRVCGCTENDCRLCIEKTGAPCFWIEDDLCSACVREAYPDIASAPVETRNSMYAGIRLLILFNGAVIRKRETNGKTVFAVQADIEDAEDGFLETMVIKIFPTKKGALGYCRRRDIRVRDYD